MPAAFAAAASASSSNPASPAIRRLITELKPIFFTSASAAGDVAPAHATVVSTFEKLTMPGTVALATGVCADTTAADDAHRTTPTAAMTDRIFTVAPTVRWRG